MSKDTKAFLEGNGAEYATSQDAAQALLKLVSDPSINGENSVQFRNMMLSITGRAFGILPRTQVKSGYVDLDTDDYKDGEFMKPWDDEIAKVVARAHR